jgi:hypothetical protein
MAVTSSPSPAQRRVDLQARQLGRFVAIDVGFTRPDLTQANHASDLLINESLLRDNHIRSLGFHGRVSQGFVREFDRRRKLVERIRDRHCEQLRIGKHVVHAIPAPKGVTDSGYHQMRLEIEAERVSFDVWKASPEFAAYPADCAREIEEHYRSMYAIKGPGVADHWREEALRMVVPLGDMQRRSTLTYEADAIPGLPFLPDELDDVARSDVERTRASRAVTMGAHYPRRIAQQMCEKLGDLIKRGDAPLTKTLQDDVFALVRFASESNFRSDPLVTRGVNLLQQVIATGMAADGDPLMGRVPRKALVGMAARFRKQESLYAAFEQEQVEEAQALPRLPSEPELGLE